ncbi:hypothetical protein SRABI133_05196 [Peribacillus simplex]|uniref:Uncharacterized protein n=1 Tax=Peribacillus simplex TaxID=1478 RepID=A0A9W4LBL5_9BACI|nr:hypothetical protein SRABI133_05196 [Peribacillus simplex]
MERPVALTIPCVTDREKSSPSGLPIANTSSPGRMLSELPNLIPSGALEASIVKTAKSVKASAPTTAAVDFCPSYNEISTSLAPSIT